jgi:hypothetical protein
LNIIKHTQQIMLLCARRGPSRTQSPSCTHRPTRGGHQSGSSCAAANDFQDYKMQPRLPAPRPRLILLLTHTRITLNLFHDATPDLGLERLGARQEAWTDTQAHRRTRAAAQATTSLPCLELGGERHHCRGKHAVLQFAHFWWDHQQIDVARLLGLQGDADEVCFGRVLAACHLLRPLVRSTLNARASDRLLQFGIGTGDFFGMSIWQQVKGRYIGIGLVALTWGNIRPCGRETQRESKVRLTLRWNHGSPQLPSPASTSGN